MLLQAKSVCVNLGDRSIITNLDFNLRAGERWGVLGGNGSGKTTMLHTFAGLRGNDSGEIFVENRNIHAYSRKDLARRVGILFQDSPEGFPVTVLESTLSGRFPYRPFWAMDTRQDISICLDILEEVELKAFAQRQVHTLSGGERRRLALATLMVQAPRVWLLDEPTNHMDLHYQISLLDLVTEKITSMQGGLIMVLHDVNLLVRFCTHVLMIIDAENRIYGSIEDVVNTDNLERLYSHPVKRLEDGGIGFYYPA